MAQTKISNGFLAKIKGNDETTMVLGGATAKWSKILFLWIPLKIAGIVDIEDVISREKNFREKKSTGRSPICGFPAIFAFLPLFEPISAGIHVTTSFNHAKIFSNYVVNIEERSDKKIS